jgi:hypothetical protein
MDSYLAGSDDPIRIRPGPNRVEPPGPYPAALGRERKYAM